MTLEGHSEYGRGVSVATGLSTSLECRECGVICERVVSPWRCLRERRTCVYCFRDDESIYFGCLHKVFSPELDLSAMDGERQEGGKNDPYGPLRVMRAPRPQCPVTVERAYCCGADLGVCVNPVFLRETFRAELSAEEQPRAAGGPMSGCPSAG